MRLRVAVTTGPCDRAVLRSAIVLASYFFAHIHWRPVVRARRSTRRLQRGRTLSGGLPRVLALRPLAPGAFLGRRGWSLLQLEHKFACLKHLWPQRTHSHTPHSHEIVAGAVM